MTLSLFVVASVLLTGFFGVIWEKSDWKNVLIKCLFILMTVWGVFLAAQLNGYIIKGP